LRIPWVFLILAGIDGNTPLDGGGLADLLNEWIGGVNEIILRRLMAALGAYCLLA
jgi:hypothetical protein